MLAKNKHIFLIGGPLLLGSTILIATGVSMAADGAAEAALMVGGTNQAMVLAFAGAAMLIASGMVASMVFQTHETQAPEKYAMKAGASLCIALTGMVSSYFGIHLGIGSLLPATLSSSESIGIQALIAMPIMLLISFCSHQLLLRDLEKQSSEVNRQSVIAALSFSVIGLLAVTIGPSLTTLIGTAAANSVEKIALEAIIALGLCTFQKPSCFLLEQLIPAQQEQTLPRRESEDRDL